VKTPFGGVPPAMLGISESEGPQSPATQARTAEHPERQAEAKSDTLVNGGSPAPRLRALTPVAKAGDEARGHSNLDQDGTATDPGDRKNAAGFARKLQPEAVTASPKPAPELASNLTADTATPPAEHKVEAVTTPVMSTFGPNGRMPEPKAEHIQGTAPTVEIVEEPSKISTGPTTVELEVGENGQQKVHLRVTERGGQVEVAMRSADSTLSRQMRAEIPELTSQLDRQGWKFEPIRRELGTESAATLVTAPPQVMDSQNSGFSESSSRRNDTAQHMAQQSYGSESGPDSRRNDWETWIDEIEKSLDGPKQGVWQ
jgi:hypothetical protein